MKPQQSSSMTGGVEDLAGQCQIHRAVVQGSRRQVKKALLKGIKVDVQNEDGQSPLFLACLEGRASIVDLLLRHDACPNMRSSNGSTPVHAAAFAGHVRTLEKLIDAGGDLRLHDNEGRSPRDWALLQDYSKKKKRMIDFIEKSRLYAMSSKGSPEFLRPQKDTSLVGSIRNLSLNTLRRLTPSSLVEGFRQWNSHGTDLHNVKSAGFGKIYFEGKDHKTGSIAAVPLIDELDVIHNNQGVTYNNGPFMVMESMIWGKSSVTAKRLHRNCPQGGVVDLLIEEHNHIVKLRHSNILLLMALCQTDNLDGMVLLYEPVAVGSLYHYLHERFETVSRSDIRSVAKQIASALFFLHQQNIVHCWVTSHAVQLVTPHLAKLGNFEYAIEQDSLGERLSQVAQNTYANAAYNWMAPEVMEGTPPLFASDLYSFCVVMWEMFMGEVPWNGKTADTIAVDVLEEGRQLPVAEDNIPMPYNVVLEWGLALKPENRKISMEQLLEILQTCSMNPVEKRWRANSKSSVEGFQKGDGEPNDGQVSSDLKESNASSGKVINKLRQQRSAEYLIWYKTHHGGQGPVNESNGLFRARPGALHLDHLRCKHVELPEQHPGNYSSCDDTNSDMGTDYGKRYLPSDEKSSHQERDYSMYVGTSSPSKRDSHSHDYEKSSHCDESCLHCEGYQEHYQTREFMNGHQSLLHKQPCTQEPSSQSDIISGSLHDGSMCSCDGKAMGTGSQSLAEAAKPSFCHEGYSGNDKDHSEKNRSESSQSSEKSYVVEKNSILDYGTEFDSCHSLEGQLDYGPVYTDSAGQYPRSGTTTRDKKRSMKSRFNSGIRHGTLTLPGKNQRSPSSRNPSKWDASQTSSVSSIGHSKTEEHELPGDKCEETESDGSTMSTSVLSNYKYIRDPVKRRFFRQASALIAGELDAKVSCDGEGGQQGSKYKESNDEMLGDPPTSHHIRDDQTSQQKRRSSMPVHLPSTKQLEQIIETYRRHNSAALSDVYGTAELIQQRATCDSSPNESVHNVSDRDQGSGRESKSPSEWKKRNSYGSLPGFKPATHIREHVLDYKKDPSFGAFQVAKGRISSEKFAELRETVARMDMVVAEVKRSAEKFRSKAAHCSLQHDADRTSKMNTDSQVQRNSGSSLCSQDGQNEWYAGRGSVQNLIEDYEEKEKEVLLSCQETIPVYRISPQKSPNYGWVSEEHKSDEWWSDDGDVQMHYMIEKSMISGRSPSTKPVADDRQTSTDDVGVQTNTDMGVETNMDVGIQTNMDVGVQTNMERSWPLKDDSEAGEIMAVMPFPQTGSDSLLERKAQRQRVVSQTMTTTKHNNDERKEVPVDHRSSRPKMVSTGSNTDRSPFQRLKDVRMGKTKKEIRGTGITVNEFVESVASLALQETRNSMENFESGAAPSVLSNPSADDLQGESIECHHGSFETDDHIRPTPRVPTANRNEKKKMEVTFSNVVLEKSYTDQSTSMTSSSEISSDASPESSTVHVDETVQEQQKEEIEDSTKQLEIEEFYFDDVINPSMCKDKHMRLQATMSLDTSLLKGDPILFDDSAAVETSQGDSEAVPNTPLPTPIISERKKQLLACSTPNHLIPHMVEISNIQNSSGNSDEVFTDANDLSVNKDESVAEEECGDQVQVSKDSPFV